MALLKPGGAPKVGMLPPNPGMAQHYGSPAAMAPPPVATQPGGQYWDGGANPWAYTAPPIFRQSDITNNPLASYLPGQGGPGEGTYEQLNNWAPQYASDSTANNYQFDFGNRSAYDPNATLNGFNFAIKSGSGHGRNYRYELQNGEYRPVEDLGFRSGMDTNEGERSRNVAALIAATGGLLGYAGVGAGGAGAGAGAAEGATVGGVTTGAEAIPITGYGAAETAALPSLGQTTGTGLFGTGLTTGEAVQLGSLGYGLLNGGNQGGGQRSGATGGSPIGPTGFINQPYQPAPPVGQSPGMSPGPMGGGAPSNSPSAQMWQQYAGGLFGNRYQPPSVPGVYGMAPGGYGGFLSPQMRSMGILGQQAQPMPGQMPPQNVGSLLGQGT